MSRPIPAEFTKMSNYPSQAPTAAMHPAIDASSPTSNRSGSILSSTAAPFPRRMVRRRNIGRDDQATHPFAVSSGQHAVRTHPHPARPAATNFNRTVRAHAGNATSLPQNVRRCLGIRGDLRCS